MFFARLTDLEKSRLIDSKANKTGAERYTDHVILEKLKGWLSETDEVELILKHMDYKKLGKIITPETFFSLSRISEKALAASGLPSFRGRDVAIAALSCCKLLAEVKTFADAMKRYVAIAALSCCKLLAAFPCVFSVPTQTCSNRSVILL